MGFMTFNFRQIDAMDGARSAIREYREQRTIRPGAPARRAAIR
jgi:hypothetical protein